MVFVLTLLATTGITLSGVAAQSGGKDTSRQDPISKLPAEEQEAARQRVMEEARRSQPPFITSFIDSGRDVHELPLFEMSPQVRTTADLQQAVQQATVIVRGAVLSQSVGENGGVFSTIRVNVPLKGDVSGEISVQQPGGPHLNGRTPTLA